MAAAGQHRDFASLLDELLADEAERRAAASRPATGLDFLNVIDEIGSGLVVADEAAARYREHADERNGDAVSAPPIAPELPRPSTDPADIARELGLAGRKKPGDLDAMRRRFALANHPDRVPPELRAVSMVRMQVANMLIDDAKRARR
jgi:hypothetical protein